MGELPDTTTLADAPGDYHPTNPSVEQQLVMASHNPYAGLEVADGGEDDEEEDSDTGGTARRAAKLWSTVQAGDGRFHVMLMHAATHMGKRRMIEMVENYLLINAPVALTAKAIRANYPTQRAACITGKAKKSEPRPTKGGKCHRQRRGTDPSATQGRMLRQNDRHQRRGEGKSDRRRRRD